ncbi:MAG: helix-turn-helix domain-containing protein, partial [Bacteroidia bacterium]
MSVGEKVLFFFSFLGAFNAFILGIYFIFFTTKKHLSSYLLGALLVVLSIRIGKSVIYFFDSSLPRIYLQLGLTACLFIGPFLYFFIKSEAKKIKRLPSLWIWQLVGWLLLIVVIGTIYPYEYFASLWWYYIIPLIYLQWGIYIVFSVFILSPIVKRLFHKQELRAFEKWILTIFGGVLLLFVSYVWAILNITKGSYIGAAVFFSSILYLVIF